MEWLHTPSYWWALIGAVGNICTIAVFIGTLMYLFFGKRVHAFGALITFAIYLTLFYIEPPSNVQSAMVKEPVQPESALRTVMFAWSLFLLLRKTMQAKPV